ncbi:MAG: hypothetical protein F4X92_10805 [Gammaproteobacteria bacterium]|nr:hypothetical protein [Gammaproteobacteria bacterium]
MSVPKFGAKQDFMQRLFEWQQGDFSLESGALLFRDVSPNNQFDQTGVHNSYGYCYEKMPGFVVISQTCDIVRKPVNNLSKFVSVCPLVEINPSGISNIEKGKAPGFGLIENTPDNLVVDFSRIMSVSKNLLVTWSRKQGCSSESKNVNLPWHLSDSLDGMHIQMPLINRLPHFAMQRMTNTTRTQISERCCAQYPN